MIHQFFPGLAFVFGAMQLNTEVTVVEGDVQHIVARVVHYDRRVLTKKIDTRHVPTAIGSVDS